MLGYTEVVVAVVVVVVVVVAAAAAAAAAAKVHQTSFIFINLLVNNKK